MSTGLRTWAYAVAEEELACTLSQRWAHSRGVARRATELVDLLGTDIDVLASAAILHDVDMRRGLR